MAARPKITVVGAGNVGAPSPSTRWRRSWATSSSSTWWRAFPRARRSTSPSRPVHGYDSRLVGSNGYDETADSDIVVITAGLARSRA